MAIMNITSNNFGNLVLKSQKPSLVLFWAMGSPRNNMWDKMLHILDEEGTEDITICKLSVNYAPHIAMRFHIAMYPTLALFRGKELIGTASGDATMGKIKDLIALLDKPKADEDAEGAAAISDNAVPEAAPLV